MLIHVKLFADLRPYGHDGSGAFDARFPEGTTVGGVLDSLSIPPDKPKILLVNGVHSDRSRRLSEGETLAVFPPVAGG